tara:strand:+ start:417 stop:725 length:309 start_codon:yes stop_codon:yes gene_type:complete
MTIIKDELGNLYYSNVYLGGFKRDIVCCGLYKYNWYTRLLVMLGVPSTYVIFNVCEINYKVLRNGLKEFGQMSDEGVLKWMYKTLEQYLEENLEKDKLKKWE